MSDKPVFIYAATYATYATHADALADYDTLLDLHDADFVGTYDVAVITKDEKGKVHIKKHEKPTQHATWTGIGVGAVLGVLFPPSIIGTAVLGGITGGVVGHLARGMSRDDMRELGDLLDAGQAGLVVVGESKAGKQLDEVLTRAQKTVERQIDADSAELSAEIERAERDAATKGA